MRLKLTVDILFRIALGATFAYMIYAALQMPRTTFGHPAAYPLFVGIVGLGLWLLSTVHQVTMALQGKVQGRIYDISFDVANLPQRTIWLRTFAVFAMVGAILLGVWLVNFHVTIPLFLLFYLRFIGRARWGVAILAALLLEIPIVVLYGSIINTAWPQSVLESILGISFQSILEAPYIRWL